MASSSNQNIGASPLLLMARRMCVKVVRGEYSIHTFMICILSLSSFQLTVNKLEITDVGLARYEVIRPILQKIENPQQLVSAALEARL